MSKWIGQTDYNPYPKFESRSFSSCMLSKTVIRHVNVKNVLDISSHTDWLQIVCLGRQCWSSTTKCKASSTWPWTLRRAYCNLANALKEKYWLLNLKTATPQCEGIIDEVRSGQRGGGSAEAAYDGSPSQAQNIELLCSTPERRWVRGVGDILWWSNGGLKGKPPVRGVSSWWIQQQI